MIEEGMNVEQFSGKLYHAYCLSLGGRLSDGTPLPSWEELKKQINKQAVVKAWIDVGIDACHRLEVALPVRYNKGV